jgi:hypothetical protein
LDLDGRILTARSFGWAATEDLMSNTVLAGLAVGAALVLILFMFLQLNPEQYANFETALATATAVLGFGIAAAGTFNGGQQLMRTDDAAVAWAAAKSTGTLVLGGAALVFASSLIGG